MDGHPIPQDVTGFQFKLIGAMTIKQFAYVTFGVVMSAIIYYSPINILIKILLIPIFGLGGTALAFLPIEGRPIDVVAFNFFKSLFSPNQFVYQKTGRQLSFTQPISTKTIAASDQITINQQQETQAIFNKKADPTQVALDQKEATFLNSITSTPIAVPQAINPQPITPTQITQAPIMPQPEMPQIKTEPVVLQNTTPQQALANQPIPSPAPITQPVQSPPPQLPKTANLLHVSDTPNIIMGIIKDSRNNVLPGMLVEVKDQSGNPVRAFKTNALGQFSSATPLAFGSYTVEIDDPKGQHSFPVTQIIANNQILLPIEIISRDAREDLRKELFN